MEKVKKMTIEEKASLCSGKNVWETQEIERLNIPSIMMADGPHGLRKQNDENDNLGVNNSIKSTCFPPAATVACSFDRNLLFKMGESIANECLEEDVDILLGPGINIKRSPLCGRNFEYYSEDPFLAGELGASFVRGVQSKGVGTSLKHYAANNQEKYRQTISSEVDERALREIYLAPFERVVKEQPFTIMCSYNKLNGIYASEHKRLLTDILRDEWGYKGIVVTDWGACNDRVLGLEAGQDLEMPTSHGLNNEMIVKAVKNNELDENVLDKTVSRILTLIDKCKETKNVTFDKSVNHDIARMIAAQSMVLLKNDDKVLPLNKNKSIAIIGELAKYPRYQGSGSSKINPIKLENVFNCLENEEIPFDYARGYDVKSDKIDEPLIIEAVELAKKVDIPVLFIGLTEEYESEGFDRVHMNLPHSHDELVRAVAKVNKNVVVVLSGGSPIEMPWVHDVKGILHAYLGGESGAHAILDILYGRVNPSGKLPETYPVKLEDNPSFNDFPGGNASVHYKESIYVGYRYYDKTNQKVLFPFGYGLSYTTFIYRDIKIEKKEDMNYQVTFTVKNTGEMDGSEVCQVYVTDMHSKIFKPVKELKGFEKVFLKAGEEKTVTLLLDKRSFAYYHTDLCDWVVNSGEYKILIGSSSQDIHLKENIEINSNDFDIPSRFSKDVIPSYYDVKNNQFKKDEFEVLLNRPIPDQTVKVNKPYTLNARIEDIKHTFVGGLLYRFGMKALKKRTKNIEEKSTILMMEQAFLESPLRAVITFSGLRFNQGMVHALLMMINGKVVRGFIKLMKARKG